MSGDEHSALLPPTTPRGSPTSFRVYASRWWMLTVFSVLALLNNMVCYSFAPIYHLAKGYYGTTVNLDNLVTSFFISYVVFSFPSSWVVGRFGLRSGVVVGAWLQAAGSSLRVLGKHYVDASTFPCLMAGQVIASLGQAFFVNPPPLLAAAWFADDERTLATTVSVNANTLGIAVVYFVAPALVITDHDITLYLELIAGLSCVMATLATLTFASKPPTPPSKSAHDKVHGGGASSKAEEALSAAAGADSDDSTDDRDFVVIAAAHHPAAVGATVGFARKLSHVPPPGSTPEVLSPAVTAAAPAAAPPAPGSGEAAAAARHGHPLAGSSGAGVPVIPPHAAPDRTTEPSAAAVAALEAALGPDAAALPVAMPVPVPPAPAPVDPATLPVALPVVAPAPIPAGPVRLSILTTSNGGGKKSAAKRAAAAAAAAGGAAPLANGRQSPDTEEDDAVVVTPLARVGSAFRLSADTIASASYSVAGTMRVYRSLLRQTGFLHTVFAFAVAETCINGFSAFLNPLLIPLGYDPPFIGLLGSAFILSCMVGSSLFSFIVDRTKTYQSALLLSLGGSFVATVYFVFTLHHFAHGTSQLTLNVTLSLLLSGFFIGPIQPLAIESAAECTYPVPESYATAVQQVVGNLFSAAMFPVMMYTRDKASPNPYEKGVWILCAALVAAVLVYTTFKGQYKRLQREREHQQRLKARLKAAKAKAKADAVAAAVGAVAPKVDAATALVAHAAGAGVNYQSVQQNAV